MGIFDKLFGRREEKFGEYSEVFNRLCDDRLCDDDVKLIKNKHLLTLTPKLAAHFIMGLLRGENIRTLGGETLNKKQQFNLLVFNWFCYFYFICRFVRMKQGCEHVITETLKDAFLQWAVTLYNAKVQNAPARNILIERGRVVFSEFEAAADRYGFSTEQSAQLEVSDAFASAIFADNKPNLIRGMGLYMNFMDSQLASEFSGWFLVEEEDFDKKASDIRMTQMFFYRRKTYLR